MDWDEGIALHPPLLDDSSNPGAMKRFIQAVNANVRRYTTPASVLNAELTHQSGNLMLQNCLIGMWAPNLISHSGGQEMLKASISGETSLVPQFRKPYNDRADPIICIIQRRCLPFQIFVKCTRELKLFYNSVRVPWMQDLRFTATRLCPFT